MVSNFLPALIVLLVFVSLSCKTYDDIDSIQLKRGKRSQTILGGQSRWTYDIKNISDSATLQSKYGFDTLKFLVVTHYDEQYLYNRWRLGQLSTKDFQWSIKSRNLDTSKLSTPHIYDAETLFAIGKKGADCILIPDYNNNNLLTDDKPIVFTGFFEKIRQPWVVRRDFPHIMINNLQLFYEGRLTNGTLQIALDPVKTDTIINGTKRLTSLTMWVHSQDYLYGRVKVNGIKYHVAAPNWWQGLINGKKVRFVFAEKKEKNFLNLPHDPARQKQLSDTVILNREKYFIDEIKPFSNVLILRKVE